MQPKILFLDIETLPNVAWTWGKYDQNVLGFVQQSCLATVAYKWLGDRKVYALALPDYEGYAGGSYDDSKLCADLWTILDSADIVVAHNGNSFDVKVVNSRFIFHKMRPPSPYKKVDTKLIAKRVARFNSNKLDDLGETLGLGRKIKTDFDLWKGCMEGDPVMWRRMVSYNKQDVLLLERVYLALRPWDSTHPNMGLYVGRPVCPACGSNRNQCRGFAMAAQRKYRRYQCQDCGHWSRDTHAERCDSLPTHVAS